MNASPQAQVLSIPKAGHRPDENEDAAAHAMRSWPVHAAVADGATESAFSRQWAQILVERAVASHTVVPTASALQVWREAWREAIAPQVAAQPWYVAAKTEQGAHATYLHLQCTANGAWHAACVGDCMLFHVRNGAVKAAWPDIEAEAFDHHPDLISTHPDAVPNAQTMRGTWMPDDRFVLATDAAAVWLMRTRIDAALHWTPDAFREAAETARSANMLRNDDTTVLRLSLSA